VDIKTSNLPSILVKTLGFTFLNPHVYSDTVFFLGNFSKSLSQMDKYYFGAGAAISSFLFFFILGYLSKYFSKYLKSVKVWKRINYLIILFMSILALTVLMEII
jgi:L-lysine exporter family protein LysE/ArgO